MNHAKLILAANEDEVYVITAAATTATGGTFTLTHEGNTTTDIAHDADDDTIKAALVALGSIGADDVTVVDGGGGLASNDGTVTITFGENLGGQPVTLTADFADLEGDVHVLSNSNNGVENRIVTAEDELSQYRIVALSVRLSAPGVVTLLSNRTEISSGYDLNTDEHMILPYIPEGWFSETQKGNNINIGLSTGAGVIDMVYEKTA